MSAMVHPPATSMRTLRSLLFLPAIVGLLVAPAGPVIDTSAPSQPQLAAALLTPATPLPASSVEGESRGGEGRTEPGATTNPLPVGRVESNRGIRGASSCPWLAFDALARAGRPSSPPTGPPVSSV